MQARTANERTPLLRADVQETQISAQAGPSADQSDDHTGAVTIAKTRAPSRLISPDLLRGLLMVLMAVDHVNQGLRGFPHGTGSAGEMADFTVVRWTSDLGYALRTLSHLCAPGFTMLLGMGLAFFIESRSKAQSGAVPWPSMQYVKHIALRTLALVLANSILTLILTGTSFWFFNIVLLALAFDYLVVGLLGVVLLSVEPFVAKISSKVLSTRDSSGIAQRSRTIAFHTVNAALLLLSATMIWMNIWLDPQQGDCKRSTRAQLSALSMELGSGAPFGTTAISIHAEQNCTNDRWRLTYNVLFLPTVCRGILSIFPPMAWLPFAIFGLLYGRVLLWRLRSAKDIGRIRTTVMPDVTLEAVLAVVFALLFVSTRVFNYGDLSTNCLQTPEEEMTKNLTHPYLASLKAFFYIVKYPPSPAFAFFSLAANFALSVLFTLSAAPGLAPKVVADAVRSNANPLLVYGRQSLFFYIVHLSINSLTGPLLLKTRIAHVIPAECWDGKEEMFGVGLSVYFFAYYFCLLAVMYVLCAAYGRFKVRQSPESIWRFF